MSADIPMKIMFEKTECSLNCIQREYSTFGDSLDSLNMLRMRSGLLFLIVYGYIFESNQVD